MVVDHVEDHSLYATIGSYSVYYCDIKQAEWVVTPELGHYTPDVSTRQVLYVAVMSCIQYSVKSIPRGILHSGVLLFLVHYRGGQDKRKGTDGQTDDSAGTLCVCVFVNYLIQAE